MYHTHCSHCSSPTHPPPRLALLTAAKAVALALTPGLEPIRHVTMWSRKRGLGPQVEFVRSEESVDPNVHPEMVDVMDFTTNLKVGVGWCELVDACLHCSGVSMPSMLALGSAGTSCTL